MYDKFDLRAAELNLKRKKNRLEKLQADEPSSTLDIEDAKLAVQEAENEVKRVQYYCKS